MKFITVSGLTTGIVKARGDEGYIWTVIAGETQPLRGALLVCPFPDAVAH